MCNIIRMGIAVTILASCSANEENKHAETETSAIQAQTVKQVTSESAAATALPKHAYFGDLHIHTKNSFDAYIFNVRVTPDDAYEFAKGGALMHPGGYEIKLAGPPLDFIAVTDHGAYLGVLPQMDAYDTELSKLSISQDMFSTDPDKILAAFQLIGVSVRSGEPIPEIMEAGALDITKSIWARTVEAANRHYEPGKLTTFAGYEYTSVNSLNRGDASFAGANLHRNVFFRGKAPDMVFSTLDSTNPEDLWRWLEKQRAAGIEGFAVPHNSNVSDGQMFALETYDGEALTADYSALRMRNEPLVEITQVKGTSETHPALSPNDEWANFEIYEYLLAGTVKGQPHKSYVREAIRDGMVLQRDKGFNPFKFGFIGSSDTHVAGGGFEEDNYWSKVGLVDADPERRGSVPPNDSPTWEGVERNQNAELWFSRWSAAGLTGVWAHENTREAIYDAMRRKEAFATSGTRIKVRFFAGDYTDDLLADPALIETAYADGVPMGGDMAVSGEDGPEFLAWAVQDPMAAALQRLQIIKVWDEAGEPKEQVYDIACSDGAVPDPQTYRCPDNGASVDLSDCSISSDKGAGELKAIWRDPDFDAAQYSAYYIRVLENPTCRWSTWDALRSGVERHPDLPPTIQDRAWSSPIWYTPSDS